MSEPGNESCPEVMGKESLTIEAQHHRSVVSRSKESHEDEEVENKKCLRIWAITLAKDQPRSTNSQWGAAVPPVRNAG